MNLNRSVCVTSDSCRVPRTRRSGRLLRRACGLVVVLWAGLVLAHSAEADYFETLGLFRTGKYAECIESAAKSLSLDAAGENFRVLKLRAELELGRYADALKTLDESLLRVPGSVEIRWLGREVCRYNNQPDRWRQLDGEIVRLIDQAPWRYSDAANRIVVARYLLARGADPKQVLDGIINEVKRQQPNFPPVWLANGELALDKADFAMAAEAYAQALKILPGDPEAHLGLARAFAPSDGVRARQALQAALEINPRHVASLLETVDDLIDSERYDLAEAVLGQVAEVNPHQPQAAAYRAVLAHLRNRPDDERRQRAAALESWPDNPAVDHLIGRKLSQKYRFAEGAVYQRRALDLDPRNVPARMQLAQDLLRLGREAEGLQLANDVSAVDGYNVVAHNLIVLSENLAKFRTLEEQGIIVRMDAREAAVYGSRVLDLLHRAQDRLCPKYAVKLDEPVIVELFPRPQDFAIRTFGLPGSAGFLGVCFGAVITANSPASQAAHPSCWEATLWHEFCHVVTLKKTRNKMPRWLSEGISVYEERQENPAWGQSINPVYRKLLLEDELTPVSRLSAAFLSPPSPLHLQFAYFESSLVVEYLVKEHGLPALGSILDDLGNGLGVNDALARHTGSVEEFDARFRQFARQQAFDMAPGADWAEPDLPPRADAATLSGWLKDHPGNYIGLKRQAQQQVSAENWAAARQTLEKIERLYDGETGHDSPAAWRALVYRELGQNQLERAVLVQLADRAADDVDVFARLIELTSHAGEWELTKKYAVRWLAVNPLHPEPHRRTAEAAGHVGDIPLEIASQTALLQLEPLDPAEIHLRLATLHRRAGQLAPAKRHVLQALEDAPGFRAAQRLLLEIVRDAEAGPPKPAEASP